MKKILFINSFCGLGSTGKICCELAQKCESDGYDVKIAYGRDYAPEKYKKYAIRIGTDFDNKVHALKSRFFDNCGFGSVNATKRFIAWAESYDPDIVWLHNLHGYYINIELLFEWLKSKPTMVIKWTLHDCWPFTGHCAYFSAVNCNQWMEGCKSCVQLRTYPACVTSGNVKKNYLRKKAAFSNVNNMMLITPSKWLKGLVEKSYLKEYPVEVIYNTIDNSIFKPTQSDFRERYHIEDRIMILGVASVWEKRKGLEDFYKLAEMLDNQYVIVLVGLSRKQIKHLPKKIIGLKRTDDPSGLATIYTAADFFVNPSKEETFGMTSLEAEACGTKSIVYKDTACEEIARINGNVVVPQDVGAIYQAITGHPYEATGGGK